MDTLRAAMEKAQERHPYHETPIGILPAQAGETYYQSVLAPIQLNEALLALRRSCEEEFGFDMPSSYIPHLSLLYGDLSRETRNDIAGRVNSQSNPLPRTVNLGEVVVVHVRGTAEEWKMVARMAR